MAMLIIKFFKLSFAYKEHYIFHTQGTYFFTSFWHSVYRFLKHPTLLVDATFKGVDLWLRN